MSERKPFDLASYQPYRRPVEIGFWLLLATYNAVANTITTRIDISRVGANFASWEPMVWEVSSNFVLAALVPALAWWLGRHPFHVDTWRRSLPWHVLGSVVYSAAHVTAMVGLRKLAYLAMGAQYDFGDVLWQFFYEYLKDARTYASMALIIVAYRFWLLRLQGEARLLDTPDEGEPAEPVDRPERFLVRKLGREFLIAAQDIEWVQAAGNYVNLRVRERDYPLRSTIAGVESRLDPALFLRVHRSYIVNLSHLVAIEPLDTGDARLHLRGGHTIPCSRRYRALLRERVAGVREIVGAATEPTNGERRPTP